METSTFYFNVILAVVLFISIVSIGILRNQVINLKHRNRMERNYSRELEKEVKELKALMDEDHIVFSPHYKERLRFRPVNDRLIVAIHATDLYDQIENHWRDGYKLGADTAFFQSNLVNRESLEQDLDVRTIEKSIAAYSDSKYEQDFLDLCNEIYSIFRQYENTFQIKAQIYNCIMCFRTHMVQRQRGSVYGFSLHHLEPQEIRSTTYF